MNDETEKLETYENRTFTNADIELDGIKFINCKFIRCRISYSGGDYHLSNINFDGCTFHFFEAAGKTLHMMQTIFKSEGGKKLFDLTFPDNPDVDVLNAGVIE